MRGRGGGGPRPQVPHRAQDRVQEPAQAAVPVITVPINIYLPLSTNYYLDIYLRLSTYHYLRLPHQCFKTFDLDISIVIDCFHFHLFTEHNRQLSFM